MRLLLSPYVVVRSGGLVRLTEEQEWERFAQDLKPLRALIHCAAGLCGVRYIGEDAALARDHGHRTKIAEYWWAVLLHRASTIGWFIFGWHLARIVGF